MCVLEIVYNNKFLNYWVVEKKVETSWFDWKIPKFQTMKTNRWCKILLFYHVKHGFCDEIDNKSKTKFDIDPKDQP